MASDDEYYESQTLFDKTEPHSQARGSSAKWMQDFVIQQTILVYAACAWSAGGIGSALNGLTAILSYYTRLTSVLAPAVPPLDVTPAWWYACIFWPTKSQHSHPVAFFELLSKSCRKFGVT